MGMPITSYKILRLLADSSDVHGDDDRKLRHTLAEFRLLAVILHEPTRHIELHRLLTSRFERLDRVTGQRLLFFALVETSDEWRSCAEHRHYFSTVEENLAIEYAHAMPTPAIDPELSIVGSALSLGIPVDALPCIVVFKGDSNDFCWFATSEATIERQLERLALAASNLGSLNGSAPGKIETYLNEYEIDQGASASGKELSVLDRLASILAPSVTDFLGRDDAHRAIRHDIETQEGEVQRLLVEASRGGGEESLLKAVLGAFRLGVTIALSRGGTAQVGWPWPSRELWELEAAASLATAMKLRTLTDLEIVAPIVMCYGRSFEAEINASVVQDLRRRLGVQMPDYFCRHQPRLSARVDIVSGGRTEAINFNSKRYRRWQAPGLGQSEQVARKLGHGDQLQSEMWESLLQQWSVIRRHRNAAAHPGHNGVTDPMSVQACHDAFCRLQSAGILDAMFELKGRLREVSPASPIRPPTHYAVSSPVVAPPESLPQPTGQCYAVPELLRKGDFYLVLTQLKRSMERGPEDEESVSDASERFERLLSAVGVRHGESEIKFIELAAASPIAAMRAAAAATKLAIALSGQDPQRERELNVLRARLLLGVTGIHPSLDRDSIRRCMFDCIDLVYCLLGALSDVASSTQPVEDEAEKRTALERYSRVCEIVFG